MVRPHDVSCKPLTCISLIPQALEAGGLTHLFGQVFALTDYLTPVVIKVVTGLLRDWAEDQLTAKS